NIWDDHLGIPPARLLQHQHIIELAREGFEIGSHSFSHSRLTQLVEDAAWREIPHSKLILESILNHPVISFSYPFGLTNEKIKSLVRDVGYTIACSVYTGPAVFGSDPFEIRRITVRNTTRGMRFGMQLLTPYQHYEFVRWKAVQLLTSTN